MTKKNENLPAVPTKSFELATSIDIPNQDIAPELAAKFTPEDFEGHSETFDSLPFVTIRQKELVERGTGNILANPGSFRMSDPVFDKTTDVDGRKGLCVFLLIDTPCRVFFESSGDKKPLCKSSNAVDGTGSPGGVCRNCKLNRFHPDNKNRDLTNVKLCKEGRLILAYDPNLQGCYLLQFTPSGIKPYDQYKKAVKKLYSDTPFFMRKTLITTVYEEVPNGHYRPNFEIIGVGDDALYELMKGFKAEASERFGTLTDTAIDANPEHETLDTEAEVVDTGLPEGATYATEPNRPNKDDDDLPF